MRALCTTGATTCKATVTLARANRGSRALIINALGRIYLGQLAPSTTSPELLYTDLRWLLLRQSRFDRACAKRSIYDAILARGRPFALDTNGTVLLALGFTSIT